jgi:hypothetical protein
LHVGKQWQSAADWFLSCVLMVRGCLQAPATYFMDTMSMHIVVSGQTSYQRILYQAERSQSRRKEVLEREEQAAVRGPPVTHTYRA